MATTTDDLTAVELTGMGRLTQRQQRGQDRVWCGITPAAGSVADPARYRRGDWVAQWFPRACAEHPGRCLMPIAGPVRIVERLSASGARPDQTFREDSTACAAAPAG
ncbi:hypothetical protein [Streptomyces gardneri]|uniref:hypothetical protein n=1 Tax=Streptomyces gardneri TaxID=66892 RepID=UPI003675DA32